MSLLQEDMLNRLYQGQLVCVDRYMKYPSIKNPKVLRLHLQEHQ